MLGIYGDSYADAHQFYGGWPKDLSNLMNLKYVTYALPGSSLWYSYTKFLETYKKFTHIAFTYTHPHRWPALPTHLEKWAWLTSESALEIVLHINDSDREEMRTLLKAHKLIYNTDLDNFLYQSIFNSVNKICKDNNIKLFNVMPFEITDATRKKDHFFPWYKDKISKIQNKYTIDFSERQGPCFVDLFQISAEEMEHKKKVEKLKFIDNVCEVRGCHMNITNNQTVAQIIFENQDTVDIINAYLDKRLSYDPNELCKMIDDYIDRTKITYEI